MQEPGHTRFLHQSWRFHNQATHQPTHKSTAIIIILSITVFSITSIFFVSKYNPLSHTSVKHSPVFNNFWQIYYIDILAGDQWSGLGLFLTHCMLDLVLLNTVHIENY